MMAPRINGNTNTTRITSKIYHPDTFDVVFSVTSAANKAAERKSIPVVQLVPKLLCLYGPIRSAMKV